MAIWIDDNLCQEVRKLVNSIWPGKRVKCNCNYRSWQTSRYIQIATVIKDMDIHYELWCGRLQLHFEGKFTDERNLPLLRFLREKVPSDKNFRWRRWGNMTQGLCEIDRDINCMEDLEACLRRMTDTFDPLIASFVKSHPDLFPNQNAVEEVPMLRYRLTQTAEEHAPDASVRAVKDIPFEHLEIPPYQRPYKWTAKNVNQLITDLITFKKKEHYRLGTLVLYNNEIVDGQQRIITLCLLIKMIYGWIDDKRIKQQYDGVMAKVNAFSDSTVFPNSYSLHNVVENIHVIETRKNELDIDFLEFLLNKCEFVVIGLCDISEAFQFFDSQNARGKDLSAHDLLKAYHLREMEDLSEADSENIDEWQMQRTDFLSDIFLTMFRAKSWSLGKPARYFTKNDIDIFKGISVKSGKRYPFYQMEIIAHVFSQMYNADPVRMVDKKTFEYPFNLDDQIINGSRFFDMVRHYMALYHHITDLETFKDAPNAEKIINSINDYEGMKRTGDRYVRSMFDTLLFYYIDRFGDEELDKVVPKFFIWAYTLRLISPAVQLASVDNWAKDCNSMFRIVHDAKTPYDVINVSQDGISRNELAGTKCDSLIDLFKGLNKIYNE